MRGRFFTEADNASKPGVAVINEALARKYLPNENPIGQRITDNEGGRPTVLGLSGNRRCPRRTAGRPDLACGVFPR